jgi:hypothetical protein
MNCLEQKAFGNQWMQKAAFLELAVSNQEQELLRKENCHKSFLPGQFCGHEEDKSQH